MPWGMSRRPRRVPDEFMKMQAHFSKAMPENVRKPVQSEKPKVAQPERRVPVSIIDARRAAMRVMDGTGMGTYQEVQFKRRIFEARTPEDVGKIAAEIIEFAKKKGK